MLFSDTELMGEAYEPFPATPLAVVGSVFSLYTNAAPMGIRLRCVL